MKRIALDIESDNLLWEATKIFVVITQDVETAEIKIFTEKEGLEEHIAECDEVWGHNLIAFDAPILSKLWGVSIPKEKMQDTLLLSRMLDSDRFGGHSLASWGEEFDYPKIAFDDFTELTPEMITYCERDVAITVQLIEYFLPEVEEYRQAIDIDREFAYYMSLQEANGFMLDIPYTEKLVETLKTERDLLVTKIQTMIPDVKIEPPVYREAKKGDRLLDEDDDNFTYITDKTKTIKTKPFTYQKVNPNSRQQITAFFIKQYAWEPVIFTEKGSPDLSEKVMKSLSFPEAELLCKIIRLTKQLGMLSEGANGWLKKVDRDTSRVHGSVMVNGAVGGRCSHRAPNFAQVERKDLRMRECWVAKKGCKLIDADASGLELRMLAHYLSHFDKGAYATVILEGDIHTYNQEAMGLKKRDTAKTAIYAMIYGSGDENLGKVVSSDIGEPSTDPKVLKRNGKAIRDGVIAGITGYKSLMDLIRETATERGHIIGIDGRPLTPRNFYSALNLLLQSGGASVMKLALNNFMRMMEAEGLVHGVDFGLCANIHDEWIVETPPENTETVERVSLEAIKATSEQLEIRIPMEGNVQVGESWDTIH